ncbi:MAG: dTDP-4-amino-4,6-dideoxygalactose transaminase [Vicinamibacteria bacterium]|nr:dTDP-4-amino-4,6-dideoxygalactose transaminase [Vicinamibacteria bacterium]
MSFIPFNKPFFSGLEFTYMRQALDSGHVSGDGRFTRETEARLRALLGGERHLLTPSCTAALEMCALLLDIAQGDEIIAPAFTFVSSVNAFVLRGARPVFADIRPDTLNIDEEKIEGLITERTRAIVVVHYAGVGCEMEAIMKLAAARGVPVIEDNAHGLFGAYRGRPLGSFGRFATESFHETKNITCGEGGALTVNEERDVERADIIREKGTDRSRFFRGQVDKYGWADVGSSYLLSDLLSACLLAQFEKKDLIQARRRALWNAYAEGLAAWAGSQGAGLPVIPPHCDQSYHMFYLLLPSLDFRQRLIAHLRAADILGVFHYLPLNRSAMARKIGAERECPVTEDISDRLLRLPFFFDLGDDDQRRVIDRIIDFC